MAAPIPAGFAVYTTTSVVIVVVLITPGGVNEDTVDEVNKKINTNNMRDIMMKR